ncbi:MAG: GNAT family N-acetyltransferase [Acidobacteriota bacterium]|nr:GNAT family N-acetyltransferase [Acidobacteriota bacterium]
MRIRRYEAGDAERIYEAARESLAEISPWMPWCHPGYSLEESRGWIAHCEVVWREGREYNFAIEDEAHAFLGTCGLNQIRREERAANLGYWVRTSAAGRGVATEAVRQLADFAFRRTDLVRLEIVVAVGNAGSHRVAEKAGARTEGLVGDRLVLRGVKHPAVVYVMEKAERGRREADGLGGHVT